MCKRSRPLTILSARNDRTFLPVLFLIFDFLVRRRAAWNFNVSSPTRMTRIPIIFITAHGDIPMSVQAMKHGAIEFLTKPVREQELLDAIRHGIDRDRHRREQESGRASLRARFESLTEREREILSLVARGLLNKQIAAELGLSEVTVKVHRGHVMRKMDAKSLADLVRMSDQLAGPSPHPAILRYS